MLKCKNQVYFIPIYSSIKYNKWSRLLYFFSTHRSWIAGQTQCWQMPVQFFMLIYYYYYYF